MANILVVGPHPDDQELGMGGTIARLAAQGHDILLLDLTDGEPTPRGDRTTRLAEAAAAAAALSPPARPIRRMLLDLPNRRIVHSLEARALVAGAIRAHQANIVFTPHFDDAHPDHLAGTRIVEDARFDAKLTRVAFPGDEGRPPIYPMWLFYYYATHLRTVPAPSFLVDITGFEQAKRSALECYASQFVRNERNHGVVDWVTAAGRYFGSRIGTQAAEPFYAREPLGLTGLDGLWLGGKTSASG